MKTEDTAPLAGVFARATPKEIADMKTKGAAYQARPSPDTLEALWGCLWTLLHAAAEREAQLLLPAAQAVGQHHAAIGGAETLLASMTGERSMGRLVELGVWSMLMIPGSQNLAALRDLGIQVRPPFGTRALVGCDDPVISERAYTKAAAEMREGLTRLAGFDVIGTLREKRDTLGGKHE